jgi:hypothetical protein
MNEVKIFKLYDAIKHLESAVGEIITSGVDPKFESEVTAYIDNTIELLDLCIEELEETAE